MDAVYLCGPSRAGGEPLRYSIRTVVTNLPQVTRIVTVGHRWSWLSRNVLHIDVPQLAKHRHTYACLQTALADDRISDQLVLFNDDFFVLEELAEVPVLHRGLVADRIAGYRRTGNNTMLQRREQTRDILAALGVDEPLDYELHVPLPVDRVVMAEALERADLVRPDGMLPIGKRTLYGNLAAIGGELAQDVKVNSGQAGLPPGPFLSTASASWPGKVGTEVRRRFRTPSPYERWR